MLNQPGKIAERAQLSGARIDTAEHVEIDETVIHWRDDRIRHEDRLARDRRVMPANIDDDEVMVDARHAQLFLQLILILLGEQNLLRPR